VGKASFHLLEFDIAPEPGPGKNVMKKREKIKDVREDLTQSMSVRSPVRSSSGFGGIYPKGFTPSQYLTE
jgi:hypothetical protein